MAESRRGADTNRVVACARPCSIPMSSACLGLTDRSRRGKPRFSPEGAAKCQKIAVVPLVSRCVDGLVGPGASFLRFTEMEQIFDPDYDQMLATAEELLRCGEESRQFFPRVGVAKEAFWISGNHVDCHEVVAWSGEYDSRWGVAIFERASGMWGCGSSARADQRGAFLRTLSAFFGARRMTRSRDVLSAVIATPTRLPKDLWPAPWRMSVHEICTESRLARVGSMSSLSSVDARGLGIPLELFLGDFVWARPSVLSSQKSAFVVSPTRRTFESRRSQEGACRLVTRTQRIFSVTIEDAESPIQSADIPALREARTKVRGNIRTYAPMIQFLRLDDRGMVDLLMLETIRDSGELIDVRWGRNSLKSIVAPDPYYAAGLAHALRHGRALPR